MSEPLPLVGDLDRANLLEAARREDRGVDLRGATRHEGWESVVLHTTDGWILRFPRRARHDLELEVTVLRLVDGRLPAATPRVAWTGRHVRVMAYRALNGSSLDVDDYARAEPMTQARVAESLAEFLAAFHGCLEAGEVRALALPRIDTTFFADVDAHRARIPPGRLPEVLALRERFAAWCAAAEPVVVVHNDFHRGNLVLEERLGRLRGVWDFSVVGLGAPALDFRYFYGDHPGLAHRMMDHYERTTGRVVDRAGVVLAHHYEAVTDALEMVDRDVGAELDRLPPELTLT